MGTININTFTPEQLLVKQAFKRIIPSDNLNVGGHIPNVGGCNAADRTGLTDNLKYDIYTQADFMREYDVNAHKINSMKYYPNPWSKDSEGKYSAKVKSRIAIAYQKRILTKRVNALVGNNVNLRVINEHGDKQNLLDDFREGWIAANMEIATYDAIRFDGMTGDCAVCFYMDNGKVGWRAFGFPNGDILYPHYDPMTGKLAVFARKYIGMDGKTRVDVWDDTNYMRYVEGTDGKKSAAWDVEQAPMIHGFGRVPVAYDRYGEPFWANSQSLIDSYEMSMSQFAENNMAYALRILVTMGESLSLESTLDGTPTRIDSPTKDADVKYLEPADSSNSYTQQLSLMDKNIMKCSFAVDTPEMKSGSDMSSLTVKMLYADAYQQAQLDALHFQPFLDDMVELFKHGYGIQTGRSSDFETLNVKAELYPYVFMSETEEVSNTVQLVGIGAMSKKSAAEYAYSLGYGVNGEYNRLLQQEHDALVGLNIEGNDE